MKLYLALIFIAIGISFSAGIFTFSLRENQFEGVGRPDALFLMASLLLTGLAAWALMRRIGFQKRVEEKQRFAVQALTHELRTPLASLQVSLETLRTQFDGLDEEGQDTLLRIVDDVNRLERITEASKRCLNAYGADAFAEFHPKRLNSVSLFLQSLLENYGEKITLRFEGEDRGMSFDPYWVGICVTNLVENALRHGSKPVRVLTAVRGEKLCITVEDAGACSFDSLNRMSQPFTRGASSQGIGLGLSIVRQVSREMNGNLEFEPAPTRFTLTIGEKAA